MIRPIKLTSSLIDECVEEFKKSISASRMYSGVLKYEKTFRWQGTLPPAKILFSMRAYLKMVKLIDSFSSEIAWHCTAHRDEEQANVFHVDDVFVSPQKVTGTTVNSDQAEYEQWLCTLPDEVFNNLRMQCHSHVNMGVTPSSVDREHWSGVLNALVEEGDVFYIFMIWNKKLQFTAQVYDLTNNVYYDADDVKVDVDNMGIDLGAFLNEARDAVKTQTYYGGTAAKTSFPTTTPPAKAPAKTTYPVVAGTAKEEWKRGEEEREKELAKRKADKGQPESFEYSGRQYPRYGAGYGSFGREGYDPYYEQFYGHLYD